MSTPIQFPLVNSVSQPITGSKVTLRAFTSVSGSSTFPITVFSDNGGTASFNNVIPGLYSLKWSPGGANNPSTYVANLSDIVYLNIPDTTGSMVPNGFVYITGSIPTASLSGSGIPGNAMQLKVDISSMANYITDILNDWAEQEGGTAVVAENVDEKVLMGFNNVIGPVCLIVFVGEEAYGSDVKELEGWAKRTFDIVIRRGKIMSDPRNSALTSGTGPSRPFYQLVEEARDIIRSIELPPNLCYNPVLYNDIRPGSEGTWMMDSYIINISILVQIGRISILPPALSNPDGSPFLGLVDTGYTNVAPVVN